MEPGLQDPEAFAGFGSSAAEKLDRWLRNKGLAAKLDRWFHDGGSGAKVASVALFACHKTWHAKLVLKLCPADERTRHEVANSNRVRDEAPPAFEVHLAEPWNHFEVGDTGAWFFFQRLAGESIGDVQSLSKVPASAIAEVYNVIATSLLTDWIVSRDLGSHTVSEVLSLQLGGREEPGGPIHAWVAEHADHVRNLLDDTTYSDPLALLDEQGAGSRVVDYVFRGHAHGDLHPANVLVPTRPTVRPADYVLIDFARFEPDAVLSRDPTFLLLCLVHHHFVQSLGVQDPRRSALIELLADPFSQVGTSAPAGACDLVSSFRQLATPGPGGSDGYADNWREQKMLSTVACALMFLCRPGIVDVDREWFYQLAARTARIRAEMWYEEIRDNSMADLPQASHPPLPSHVPVSTEQTPNSNVRHVNFPLANPWGEIARLTEALTAGAIKLVSDVEAIIPGSTPEEVSAYATPARLTINKIASTLDQLDEEEINEIVGMGPAFDFTEILGEAGEGLDRVRRTMEKASRKGYNDGLVQSLQKAAERLRDLAKSLHILTHS